MGALSSLLEKEAEENSLQHYMATVGWSIGRFMYKANYLPTFTEIKNGSVVKDDRNGADIVDSIKEKLKSRREMQKNDGI